MYSIRRLWTAVSGFYIYPTGIYLFKVNNENIRAKHEIGPKLTIKLRERRHWSRLVSFVVNYKHISHEIKLNDGLVLHKLIILEINSKVKKESRHQKLCNNNNNNNYNKLQDQGKLFSSGKEI